MAVRSSKAGRAVCITRAALQAIAESPHCVRLELGVGALLDARAKRIREALAAAPHLRAVAIVGDDAIGVWAHARAGADEREALLDGVAGSESVCALALGDLFAGLDRAVSGSEHARVLDALDRVCDTRAGTLEELGMTRNWAALGGLEAAQALAGSVQRLDALRSLDLGANALGGAGGCALLAALRSPSLRTLALPDNDFDLAFFGAMLRKAPCLDNH